MYGGEKVDEEVHGEVDADEDVDHDDLVAEFVLHHIEDEQEEDAEDGLPQEITGSHKVEHHHCHLQQHQDTNYHHVATRLLSRRFHSLAQTHYNNAKAGL